MQDASLDAHATVAVARAEMGMAASADLNAILEELGVAIVLTSEQWKPGLGGHRTKIITSAKRTYWHYCSYTVSWG